MSAHDAVGLITVAVLVIFMLLALLFPDRF